MGAVSYNLDSGEVESGGIGSQAWRDSSGLTGNTGRRLLYIGFAVTCVYCTLRLRALETKGSDNNSPTQVALRSTLFGSLALWLAVGLFHHFHWVQTWAAFTT